MKIEPNSINYISKSISKSNLDNREFTLFKKIPALIKDPLDNNIYFQTAIEKIESTIPEHLFYEIDLIIVGQFPELISRKAKSVYLDGAIYVTNEQESVDDLYDDIIHELAHSLEKPYGLELYGDDKLKLEYLGKKQRLLDTLRIHGYNIDNDFDHVSDYVQEFDEFLYFDIGFDKLKSFVRGLFVTPYSATSLSEYFSEGFEHYLIHDPVYLSKISPELYIKVKYLIEPETET